MTTASPRRAAILAASLASFLDHGVSGASIDDIRARCGASVGSIYHHFGGKDALAGAVYLAAVNGYQRTFLEAVTPTPDARTGVRAAVVAHVRWCLVEQPAQARFLFAHGDAARSAAADELAVCNREFFSAVLTWWRPHVAAGIVRDLEFDVLHALWLGGAQEYCRLQTAGRTNTCREQVDQVLADGAWHALRSPMEGEQQ